MPIAIILLGLGWMFFGYIGFIDLADAETVFQQTVSVISLLISAICFVGMVICGGIQQIIKQLKIANDLNYRKLYGSPLNEPPPIPSPHKPFWPSFKRKKKKEKPNAAEEYQQWKQEFYSDTQPPETEPAQEEYDEQLYAEDEAIEEYNPDEKPT